MKNGKLVKRKTLAGAQARRADDKGKNVGTPVAAYTRNIQGNPVELTLVEADPSAVRLDPTNPRLRYSIMQLAEGERSDAACALLLTSQEETESLKASIELSRGVQEPIYLRADGRVAEGNRRVVALRNLKEERPEEAAFRTIPAWLIPDDVAEPIVQDLLNEIHLGSVRGWAPYEKGAQMRALVRTGGLIEEEVGERYRMSANEVRQHITAVDLMDQRYFPITSDPTDPNHRSKFSYFLEFCKNGRLRGHCEKVKDLPERFSRWVRDGRIDTGAGVRRLPSILDSEAATRLLEVSGFEAAVNCLARENPREQELYSLLEMVRTRLNNMTVTELVELKDSPARQEILTALRDEVDGKLSALMRVRKRK